MPAAERAEGPQLAWADAGSDADDRGGPWADAPEQVPTGLPALASIRCSGDAYAVLNLMDGPGLQAMGPNFVLGPYEAAVRRLAGELGQQLPSQQRRRKAKKKN